MKICILTSPNQWFVEYAKTLCHKIPGSNLVYNYIEIPKDQDIVFILSYHQIIPQSFLSNNRHNIVVHASDLPKGKGWAPLFWQVLEGKNEIPFTMFEASTGVDDGDIYMKRTLRLNGYELNEELRLKQAKMVIDMCLEFVNEYDKYKKSTPQKGVKTHYRKRTKEDSQLDIDKTIREQFNLFRIVNNEQYPAYFILDGRRYLLKIEKPNDHEHEESGREQ